jgi:hypothetical protein
MVKCMNLSKTSKSLFSAVVVAGFLAVAVPAGAAVASGERSVTAVSPSCVDVTKQGKSWGFPYVEVKNNCSSTQRVKVIWAWGPDSSCNTMKPGATIRDSSGGAAKFDGLRKC